tara:strand:- start:1072 stop:2172 length:1101 start_codon:yes stop_codon:yes gene_type:complete
MIRLLLFVEITILLCSYNHSSGAQLPDNSVESSKQLSSEQMLVIEQNIIKRRLAVKSGHVFLQVQSYEPPKSEGGTLRECFVEIWFEDNKWRSDYYSGDRVGILQRSIYTDEFYIHDPSNTRAILMYYKKSRPNPIPNRLIDPRKIGVVAWTIETQRQLDIENVFTRVDREEFSFKQELLGEKEVLNAQFVVSGKFGKTRFSYELSSEKEGFLPVMVSNRDINLDPDLPTVSMRLGNQYAPALQNGAWLPSKTHFQYFMNNKATMEEFVVVHEHEFDLDIDNEIFTLEGLDLPAGRAVMVDSRMKVWTAGRKLVDQIKGTDINYNLIDAPVDQQKNFSTWLWLGNGIFFSILATLIVVRRYYKIRS